LNKQEREQNYWRNSNSILRDRVESLYLRLTPVIPLASVINHFSDSSFVSGFSIDVYV